MLKLTPLSNKIPSHFSPPSALCQGKKGIIYSFYDICRLSYKIPGKLLLSPKKQQSAKSLFGTLCGLLPFVFLFRRIKKLRNCSAVYSAAAFPAGGSAAVAAEPAAGSAVAADSAAVYSALPLLISPLPKVFGRKTSPVLIMPKTNSKILFVLLVSLTKKRLLFLYKTPKILFLFIKL